MTKPNSAPTAWPEYLLGHPESPSPRVEEPIDPEELDHATRFLQVLLERQETNWKERQLPNGLPVRRRQTSMPLILEGTVTLSESIIEGQHTLRVVKDQFGEITTWQWDPKGITQQWRRRFLIAPPDEYEEDLIETEDSGKNYNRLILQKLESTLAEISQTQLRVTVKGEIPHSITPKEEAILAASYDPLMEGFVRAALVGSRGIDPYAMDRMIESVRQAYALTENEIDEALNRCRDRVRTELKLTKQNPKSTQEGRRQMIDIASNDPRIVSLFDKLERREISQHEFLGKLVEAVEEVSRDFDLTADELTRVLDQASPLTGDEGAYDG